MIQRARWSMLCAMFVLIGAFILAPKVQACDVNCGCGQPCAPGVGSPGYWMNHPEAWPDGWQVYLEWVSGCPVSQEEVICNMKAPVKGDKTYTLYSATVAALLNVLAGNKYCCIEDTLIYALYWLKYYPVGSGVKASGDAWQCSGELIYCILDQYNNGLLCAPSRDSLE